jgi:predicted PP-loop superfamily ATPase
MTIDLIKYFALLLVWFYLIRIAKIHFYEMKFGCPFKRFHKKVKTVIPPEEKIPEIK